MLWGANRNFTKAIVKAFPAYRRSGRREGTFSGKGKHFGPRPKRSSSAWTRIRAEDSERRRLLFSPLRWALILTLGYLMLKTVSESYGGIGMTSLILVAVLWGAAFSRTLTFRVMCSVILLTATAAFGFFEVNPLRVLGMVAMSAVLTILALRAFPGRQVDPDDDA